MDIADLPTPAVLVDKSRLLANIEKMQRAATAAGIRLRPHAKTHKSVAHRTVPNRRWRCRHYGRYGGRSRSLRQSWHSKH